MQETRLQGPRAVGSGFRLASRRNCTWTLGDKGDTRHPSGWWGTVFGLGGDRVWDEGSWLACGQR